MTSLGFNSVPLTAASLWERLETKGVGDLTASEVSFYLTYQFCSEVCNGGFWQFFLNTRNHLTDVTIEALEQTGFTNAASLLVRAQQGACFAEEFAEKAMERDFADDFYERNSMLFLELQADFFDSLECKEFVDLLEAYIEQNQSEFKIIRYETSLKRDENSIITIRNAGYDQ